MESWCKGCLVDNIEEDKETFIKNYVIEKKKRMNFSFDPLFEVQLNGNRYQTQHEVFNNQYLMNKIFEHIPKYDIENKEDMALVCKNWCQLFLIHESAPRVESAYYSYLHMDNINGVITVRRDSRIIYRRCACYKTSNIAARLLLHYKQEQSLFANDHLNVRDEDGVNQLHTCLYDLFCVIPADERFTSQTIAFDLINPDTFGIYDVIDL